MVLPFSDNFETQLSSILFKAVSPRRVLECRSTAGGISVKWPAYIF